MILVPGKSSRGRTMEGAGVPSHMLKDETFQHTQSEDVLKISLAHCTLSLGLDFTALWLHLSSAA